MKNTPNLKYVKIFVILLIIFLPFIGFAKIVDQVDTVKVIRAKTNVIYTDSQAKFSFQHQGDFLTGLEIEKLNNSYYCKNTKSNSECKKLLADMRDAITKYSCEEKVKLYGIAEFTMERCLKNKLEEDKEMLDYLTLSSSKISEISDKFMKMIAKEKDSYTFDSNQYFVYQLYPSKYSDNLLNRGSSTYSYGAENGIIMQTRYYQEGSLDKNEKKIAKPNFVNKKGVQLYNINSDPSYYNASSGNFCMYKKGAFYVVCFDITIEDKKTATQLKKKISETFNYIK